MLKKDVYTGGLSMDIVIDELRNVQGDGSVDDQGSKAVTKTEINDAAERLAMLKKSEYLVVDEYLVVLPDKINQDIGDDIHVNVLRSIFEVILVKELHQHIIIKYGGVVLIQIVHNDIVQYGHIEQLAIVLLDIGRNNLEQHLLADQGCAMLADVVVDDL